MNILYLTIVSLLCPVLCWRNCRVESTKHEADSPFDADDIENVPPLTPNTNKIISPMVRTKKKRKKSLDEYEESPEPNERRRYNSASSNGESKSKRGSSSYIGVSFNKRESKYLSYFTLDKMRALGEPT